MAVKWQNFLFLYEIVILNQHQYVFLDKLLIDVALIKL